MVTFTVHQPPDAPADRIERATEFVFVRDGFSWFVFLLAPVWLLVNRLWLAALGYAAVLVAAEAVLIATNAPAHWGGLVYLGLNLLTAFEASSIKRWTLARRGWTMVGTVTGRTELDCERRFFDGWLPEQPLFAPSDGPAGRLTSGSGAGGSRWSSLPWRT